MMVTATYILEGDGFLSLSAYDIVHDLTTFLQLLRSAINQPTGEFSDYLPNTRLVLNEAVQCIALRMKNYAKDIIRPMMSYYFDRFHEENGILSNTIALFKSIRMFQPYFAKTEGVNAT
jgi:hypothetical protein